MHAIGALRHVWARVVGAARIVGDPLAGPPPRLHDRRDAWTVAMLRAGIPSAVLAKLGGVVGIIHRRYGRHALPDELEGAGRALASGVKLGGVSMKLS